MRRKLKGFTLAEALITLAIIGVVASMTLPTINANIVKSQVGPALGKAIRTLETANTLAISENEVRSLNQIDGVGNADGYFYYVVSKYSPISMIDVGSVTYKKYNNSGDYASFSTAYHSKDGITYFSAGSSRSSNNVSNLPITYAGEAWPILVDTNGYNKPPNAFGKDLYLVYVDYKGSVIPSGSSEYAKYFSSTDWTTTCNTPSRTTSFNAENCAGSVAENGFKVIHY